MRTTAERGREGKVRVRQGHQAENQGKRGKRKRKRGKRKKGGKERLSLSEGRTLRKGRRRAGGSSQPDLLLTSLYTRSRVGLGWVAPYTLVSYFRRTCYHSPLEGAWVVPSTLDRVSI